MAKRPVRPNHHDPIAAANQRVLEEREARIIASRPEPVDLGIDLQDNDPATVSEFIDEWDRKAFGDPVATIKRVVYGPDPLIDQNPDMRARIEKYGLHDYVAMTREAVLTKGAAAFSGDKMLNRGASVAIARFGRERFADALADRLLKIPMRTVEIDASDTLDPLISGGNVLRDTVERYQRPGMAYKFLSQRCIELFGMRGYELVKDSQTGEVVRAGTLLLGEIRQEIADMRRAHWAAESEADVREIEDAYRDRVAREVPEARRAGVMPLGEGDEIVAGATETEEYLGQSRRGGVRVERERRVDGREAA